MFKFSETFDNVLNHESAQDAVRNHSCDVCAKGGILLSYINLYNEVKTSEIYKRNNDPVWASNLMKGLFTPQELNEIEFLFEGKGFWWSDFSNEEMDRLGKIRKEIYEKLVNSISAHFHFLIFSKKVNIMDWDVLLIGIMQLIIDNKGEKIVL